MTDFPDHFSALAATYSRARPHWPDDLFAMLSERTQAQQLAVEVGCGSGQASIGLAQHFERVLATDASQTQLDHARPHRRIRYLPAAAEHTGLPSHCADLLLAAQAAHWFRLPAFFAEARRLLKPGGLLAIASYTHCNIAEPTCDALLRHFNSHTMADWWPPQRALVDDNSISLGKGLDAEPAPTPELAMTAAWNLHQMLDYLASWSAVARYRKARKQDPLAQLQHALLPHWPQAGEAILAIHWPIQLLLGRQPA